MSKQQPKPVSSDKATNANQTAIQAPMRRVRYVRSGNGSAICLYYPDKARSQ